ncbi:related to TFB5-component of general transcription and DNA repair factor TFIIH [Sporisorium reilianum SRZ2]|uniref:General transcription and DNA repair factor IIH subunit TFB5 n=2 Tax=Sporisorium reilianum TaxID=72558 RepID=E7A2N7_SPORE|nr:related to TFB5-component of general transcription and DNA repair factor TFIIH [Sporisorium reilianum SRZ2]SJX63583.1 related to TFB5-component of general transcription and DNA repair factor TFIIH [Sporisorium reilianum f. sp. reilianum]
MKAYKGMLLTCDAAVKQLILSLDERNRFIIMDLDDTHLLISPDRIDWLRAELDVELEKNTYTLEA